MGLLSGSHGRLYEDNGIVPVEGHPLDRGLQFVNNFPTASNGGGAAGGGGGGAPRPPGGAPPTNTPPPGSGTGTSTPTGGGNFMDWFKDPGNIAGLGALIASLMGGRDQGMDPAQSAQLDQLRRIQAITEAKMRRVDPLHQAVAGLAFSRLPVSARQGITYTNTPLPPEQA